MVESETNAAEALKKKRAARWGYAAALLVLIGIAAWRLLPSVMGSGETAAGAGGADLPKDFASACAMAQLAPGPIPLADVSVSEFAQALKRPGAELAWEKSATGYILRQTISDQLSKATILNSFSFTAVDAGVLQKLMQSGEKLDCGPGGALIDRMIINGQEVPQAAVYEAALQIVGPYAVQRDAAKKQAAGTPASAAEIPVAAFSELDATYVPKERTVAGVIAMAEDVCHRTGTADAPASGETVKEWARAKTELFDIAKKAGYEMSASDLACYKDGEDELNDGEAGGGAEAPQ